MSKGTKTIFTFIAFLIFLEILSGYALGFGLIKGVRVVEIGQNSEAFWKVIAIHTLALLTVFIRQLYLAVCSDKSKKD